MKPNDQESFLILLVEHDPVASGLFKKSLETNDQFSSYVDQAFSVDEAITKLNSKQYHLLLADYAIEQESGLRLVEKVQSAKDIDIPCVLMANYGDEHLREKALNAGAVELVVKNENNVFELVEKIGHSLTTYKPKRSTDKTGMNPRYTQNPFPPVFEDSEYSETVQDKLTGLYTHSYLHDRIVLEFSSVTRYGYPLSCLVLDIDHFKTINEQYGYKVGDALLKQCAKVLFENCRLSDIVARHAGEEFAILLPHTKYEGAQQLAERLRETFSQQLFELDDEKLNLTISIGISSYPEDKVEHCSEVIEYASQALFRSKATGRNCITLYKEILPDYGGTLPDLKVSEGKILEFQRKMTEISNIARKAYLDASRTLIMMLESKDRHTAGHSASCAKYSMQVAQVMGLSVEEAEIVQHGALLHDIGKICIPDRILLKPGKLTFQEYESMKQHAYLGYKILKPIQFLQQESLIVLHHHEWWNGEGYPCKLKGNEIPLGARIVGVADTYDTIRMAGGRYKKTTTVINAVKELIAYAGIQFDPNVVAAFIEVLKMRGEIQDGEYDKPKLDQAIAAATP